MSERPPLTGGRFPKLLHRNLFWNLFLPM